MMEKIDILWQLIEPVVSSYGFELVDIEFFRQGRWILRIYIDTPDLEIIPNLGAISKTGVKIEDCVRISREISALLDVEDIIEHSYNLEVSSPGPQRPIKKPSDFQRFIGCPVKVHTISPLPPPEGSEEPPRKNFTGLLKSADESEIEVEVAGTLYKIPLREIDKAKLNPDMNRWVDLALKRK